MRKLVFVLLILCLGTLTGCREETTTAIVNDYVGVPANLRIEGTILHWDQVAGAKSYIVYADGSEVKTVKTNNYDFSALSGDVIVFQVKTVAPRGMADSPLSVSIAFNRYAAQTIIDIENYLEEAEMTEVFPEGFVEELVKKGMTADELATLIEAAKLFTQALDNTESPLEINAALKTFLAVDHNLEPFVSAFVFVALPKIIEDMIDMETHPELIAIYENIETMLAEKPDELLLGVMGTIRYLIAFQADFDNVFLADFMDATFPESMSALNVAEILVVKNEFVAKLRDNKPKAEYAVIMIDFLNIFASISPDDDIDALVPAEDKIAVATQMLLLYDLIVDLVDSFDETFFTNWTGLESDAPTEAMLNVETEILVLRHMAGFLRINQSRIDEIENLAGGFKSQILHLYLEITGIADESTPFNQLVSGIIQALAMPQMEQLADLLDAVIANILDVFVATDGELLRLQAIHAGFGAYVSQYFQVYYNDALNITYANVTAYAYARTIVEWELGEQFAMYLEALTRDVKADDLATMAETITTSISLANIAKTTLDEAQLAVFAGALDENVDALTRSLGLFAKHLAAFLMAGDVLAEYQATYVDVHDYLITTYGTNYKSNSQQTVNPVVERAYLILFSSHFQAFMTDAETTLAEDALAAAISLIQTLSAYSTVITADAAANIIALETDLTELLDYLLVATTELALLDVYQLSTAQIAALTEMRDRIRAVIG